MELKDIPIYGELEEAITWGDDYELCFTAPAKAQSDVFNNIAKNF